MPFDHIVSRFFPHTHYQVQSGETGWNNTTRYVETEEGRYVLRIYETHRESAKIRFEHEVLLALDTCQLPVATPIPMRTVEGDTYVLVEDGSERYACMFRYLPGVRPNGMLKETAYSKGQVMGILSKALANVQVSVPPAYPPYYELDSAHPTCSQEKIAAFCLTPPAPFEDQADELKEIYSALMNFRAHVPELRALPHQLVHGDVNDSNLLVHEQKQLEISAVLDFEFCTLDLRAMEPAVVLSGMLVEEPAWDAIDAFLRGYRSVIQLSEEERRAMPFLIQLRKLDVFVHFLGRYFDQVDRSEVLVEQIQDAAKGLRMLHIHNQRIKEFIEATV
ncbi:hypothetical protein BVG16_22855 [Paenibacillus selenitireducens]|uniref:Aminoglycoside phosphotransferase domain-containing protein n=1 Tax=Paenibacillus selenitireducens TaxID=1324314 RepID=A0A1T2X428_9BACL|nr:phosphotransferase [Paenibacillus selenitireducens]OPA74607.1 hypothetical protein BVG16_22855 [Paenibacillus selenitireducens]